MNAEVQIIEGGQLLRTDTMKLKLIKEFSDDIDLYENEQGRAVIHYKKKSDFILVSIDMA